MLAKVSLSIRPSYFSLKLLWFHHDKIGWVYWLGDYLRAYPNVESCQNERRILSTKRGYGNEPKLDVCDCDRNIITT